MSHRVPDDLKGLFGASVSVEIDVIKFTRLLV